jgi:hypothetical protein
MKIILCVVAVLDVVLLDVLEVLVLVIYLAEAAGGHYYQNQNK